MRVLRWAAVIGAALLACACLPVTTKTPVGSTVGFAPDPALVGVWRGSGDSGDKKKDFGFIVFVKNEDDTMTAILPEDDRWTTYSVKISRLGDHTFMNVRELLQNGKAADDGLAGQQFPILYSVKGNKLTFALLDEKRTAAAIKSGAIAGTIEPGDYGDVHITAEATVLDAFMQSPAGLALFAPPSIVMRKID